MWCHPEKRRAITGRVSESVPDKGAGREKVSVNCADRNTIKVKEKGAGGGSGVEKGGQDDGCHSNLHFR